MKRKVMFWNIIGSLLVCIVALSFILTACTSKSTETTPDASETMPPATDTAPAETDYSGLGLTDLEIQALKERGNANVDSAEVASKIAGFKVFEPSYVPDGYTGGKFSVSLSGAGLPEEMKPKFNNTKVQRIYSYRNSPSTMILLIQTVHQFSVGGGEPGEICSRPAERAFAKADPQRVPYDSLTFVWEIDGNYFMLTGLLNETLDEDTLVKMACSISFD